MIKLKDIGSFKSIPEILDDIIKENISKGHKFATEDILKGQPIIKYGAHIGVANRNIKSGEWVHIHNIDGERGRGDLDSKTKEISQNGIRDHVILNNKKIYCSD